MTRYWLEWYRAIAPRRAPRRAPRLPVRPRAGILQGPPHRLAALVERAAQLTHASTSSWAASPRRRHRSCARSRASAATSPTPCWSPLGTTRSASALRQRSRACAGWHHCRVFGQDDRPPPAQPWWRSPGQQRTLAHRHGRLAWHQPTKDYMARRTGQGLSKKEVVRCLSMKRGWLSSLDPA